LKILIALEVKRQMREWVFGKSIKKSGIPGAFFA